MIYCISLRLDFDRVKFLIKITKVIDKGEIVGGLFLDLSKTFDTVNHENF